MNFPGSDSILSINSNLWLNSRIGDVKNFIMKPRFDIITEARKTLELKESATSAQIKDNFRELIKKWHPDRHRPTGRKRKIKPEK